MRLLALCMLLATGQALAEACIVTSSGAGVEVKVCQDNINIPTELFRSGYCQPQLAGQVVRVEFVEQCPSGAFGICRNAEASNFSYRQNIHYYGVAGQPRNWRRRGELSTKAQWPETDWQPGS